MKKLEASGLSQGMRAHEWFALGFGLFLGLAILKFGNPIILDAKIPVPTNLGEAWIDPWPARWACWLLLPLALVGSWMSFRAKPAWPASRWLWVLPLIWFGWQLASATRTVDGYLTGLALAHFLGCIACYFLGTLILGRDRGLLWLVVGILPALIFCLVRAANQRLVELPQDHRNLIEGQRVGWTNFTAEAYQGLKKEGFVITKDGVDVANPTILARLEKRRVYGTLVYPNALAGALLLLAPVMLTLSVNSTRQLRPVVRAAVVVLAVFLAGAGLFWTGSKSGWLIALALSGLCLFRLRWPARLKWIVLLVGMGLGLGLFTARFAGYFARGAASVGARFDYWRAAAQTAVANPLFGSGPGTFQYAYSKLKPADAEMARLAHNDYLEQFSDSGVVGGISYSGWIALLLAVLARRVWKQSDPLEWAAFLGLLGWFGQGVSEFGLYVPALAWTAFALGGALLASIHAKRPEPWGMSQRT